MEPRPGYKPLSRSKTKFPKDLDEAFKLVEEGAYGWTWDTEEPKKPYLSWSMVKEIEAKAKDDKDQSLLIIESSILKEIVEPGGILFPKEGVVTISEKQLFGLMILMVVKGVCSCGDKDKHPIFYGEEVQSLFNKLAEEYIN